MTPVEIGILAVTVPVAVVVNGLGCWVWSRAIADAHRARAHAVQADVNEITARAGEKAIDARNQRFEMPPLPGQGGLPSDDELKHFFLNNREAYDDTGANENQGDRHDLERANQFIDEEAPR